MILLEIRPWDSTSSSIFTVKYDKNALRIRCQTFYTIYTLILRLHFMSGVGTLPICRHGMRVIKPEPESRSSSVTGSVRHSTLVQKKRGNISIMKSMKLMFCTFLVISCQIFSSFPLPTNVLRNPCAESHLKNKVFLIYKLDSHLCQAQ